MIQQLSVFLSQTTNPYENLATEEFLTFHTEPGECILFLWQNARTVVIGRNQNCWKECRVAGLEADGGHLARRLSGGGAVYHDLGNLNFTFCMKKTDADVPRQMQVIIRAVASFGLDAQATGRNDAAINGRKFSGNAFFDSQGCYYHHGTLLLDVDTAAMSRFLHPSRSKLASKGVDSVRSRVVNLSTLCPDITAEAMKQAMIQSFSQVYHLPVNRFHEGRLDRNKISRRTLYFDSREWKYGRRIPFTNRMETHFDWGEAEFTVQVNRGIIETALLSSDAMEYRWFADIGPQFAGCPYEVHAIQTTLTNILKERNVPDHICHNLCDTIREQL
ncbi:MAG: lipoate--protein ligase [Clostridiales bacterium]|nr:lipoate--protein ligase [Clostridiales bacterium]